MRIRLICMPSTSGHIFVSNNDVALCGCGLIGDVESLVAGGALPRRAMQMRLHCLAARALFNVTALLALERISLGGSVF